MKTTAMLLFLSTLCIRCSFAGETTLHGFGSPGDGFSPETGVLLASNGNLYGTTYLGGAYDCGAVYQLVSGSGGAWTESVIYSFTCGDDGAYPLGVLVEDSSGRLFGTTTGEICAECLGAHGPGTVFYLTLSNGTWAINYFQFNSTAPNAYHPLGGVTLTASGDIYSTTSVGGTYGDGAFFKLIPPYNGGWTLDTLYSFGSSPTDGQNPTGNLIWDSGASTFYGIASNGGTYDEGTVFALTYSSGWTETVLYNFTGGADGGFPLDGLTFDSSGNLYGTAFLGGGTCSCGVVYTLANSGSGWTETVLWTFTGYTTGTQGAGWPESGVVVNGDYVYGAASGSDAYDGILYKVPISGGSMATLYAFSGGPSGRNPQGRIVRSGGVIYGTTYEGGGDGGGGEVFSWQP